MGQTKGLECVYVVTNDGLKPVSAQGGKALWGSRARWQFTSAFWEYCE